MSYLRHRLEYITIIVLDFMKFQRLLFVALLISASLHVVAQLTWTQVAPGVWKGVVGKPEAFDLLKAAGAVPNKEALGKMNNAAFPLNKTDISAKVSDRKTYLSFPL